MTDNEKLIEEAAKAIWDADTTIPETWDNKSVVEWDRNTYRGMARAALSVFEKAHTPTDDEREAMRRIIAQGSYSMTPESLPYEDVAYRLAEAGFGFRRTEVPEPSAEVLSDWFTSSYGVAVVAVKPMTDRGPSVMVDGRVISPNDVASLVEFKTQGKPSDAQVALIDAAESMTPDEIHHHPMAALDKLRALARELRVAEKALGEATVTPTAHEVTTDEREKLVSVIADARSGDDFDLGEFIGDRPLADRIFSAGFRRTEVPEPSAEHQKHADARRAETMTLISHSEPQGEPSDAHREAVAYADDIAEGGDPVPDDYERHYCEEDGEDWPCATVRARSELIPGEPFTLDQIATEHERLAEHPNQMGQTVPAFHTLTAKALRWAALRAAGGVR